MIQGTTPPLLQRSLMSTQRSLIIGDLFGIDGPGSKPTKKRTPTWRQLRFAKKKKHKDARREVNIPFVVRGLEPDGLEGVSTVPYPLKLQGLGKFIFYRHIAHVTQKVAKCCVFKR